MAAPWDIYRTELMKAHPHCGHPMWFPEPCSQFGEVHLGDVGYISQGEFVFLFNAIEPEHPRNARGVPSDPFTPPPLSEKSQPYYIAPGAELCSFRTNLVSLAADVSSTPTAGSAAIGACYEFAKQTGALLRLKEGAHASRLTCEDLITKYMSKHIGSWHAFAIGPQVGASIKEEDIVFVYGHMKASEWQLAAFRNQSNAGKLYLHAGVPSVAGGGFHVSFNAEGTATVPSRCGPIPAHAGPDRAPVNHSIFLRYFQMKRRIVHTFPMKAAAGPHELPPRGDEDSRGFTQVLCDYVLRHSGAQFACISERDIVSVAEETRYPVGEPEGFESMCPEELEQILTAFRPPIVWNADSGVAEVACDPMGNHPLLEPIRDTSTKLFLRPSPRVSAPKGVANAYQWQIGFGDPWQSLESGPAKFPEWQSFPEKLLLRSYDREFFILANSDHALLFAIGADSGRTPMQVHIGHSDDYMHVTYQCWDSESGPQLSLLRLKAARSSIGSRLKASPDRWGRFHARSQVSQEAPSSDTLLPSTQVPVPPPAAPPSERDTALMNLVRENNYAAELSYAHQWSRESSETWYAELSKMLMCHVKYGFEPAL